jgi:hypothetical protein
MKYMLLIHQGDTPTPRSPDEWANLSEEEQQAVYADYQALTFRRGARLDARASRRMWANPPSNPRRSACGSASR